MKLVERDDLRTDLMVLVEQGSQCERMHVADPQLHEEQAENCRVAKEQQV